VVNKEAPEEIQIKLQELAHKLESFGYSVRHTTETPLDDKIKARIKDHEVYLPWKNFNEVDSMYSNGNSQEAADLAAIFAPGYAGLKQGVQRFLARNARMVAGEDLRSPALFLVTWSEDGAESLGEKTFKTGNVGHPIAIAAAYKIPIFNFGKPNAEARISTYLGAQDGGHERSDSRHDDGHNGQHGGNNSGDRSGGNRPSGHHDDNDNFGRRSGNSDWDDGGF
jgi:hypothetical protein